MDGAVPHKDTLGGHAVEQDQRRRHHTQAVPGDTNQKETGEDRDKCLLQRRDCAIQSPVFEEKKTRNPLITGFTFECRVQTKV